MNAAPVWLLLTAGALAAGTPYVPDLKRWRLELPSAPGGWVTERRQEITFKLVDPGDPNPPRPPADRYDPYEDAESYRPPVPEPDQTPDQLRRQRLREEAERKANLWRERIIQVWFNGEPMPQFAEVNAARQFRVESQDGENRLDLLELESGARATRSWWVSIAQNRLQVTVLRDQGYGYPTGELQVVEPDGTVGDYLKATPSGGRISWMAYSHPQPPAGTYTVRWKAYPWQAPVAVTVQVLLDPGSDREHRWRLNRLILPGSPPTLLGTFDVDP